MVQTTDMCRTAIKGPTVTYEWDISQVTGASLPKTDVEFDTGFINHLWEHNFFVANPEVSLLILF